MTIVSRVEHLTDYQEVFPFDISLPVGGYNWPKSDGFGVCASFSADIFICYDVMTKEINFINHNPAFGPISWFRSAPCVGLS